MSAKKTKNDKYENFKLILALIILALAIIFAIRLLSGEDNWVCRDGKWVKHGQPKAAMPTRECK